MLIDRGGELRLALQGQRRRPLRKKLVSKFRVNVVLHGTAAAKGVAAAAAAGRAGVRTRIGRLEQRPRVRKE